MTLRGFLSQRLDRVVYVPIAVALAALFVLVATTSRNEELNSHERVQAHLDVTVAMLRDAALQQEGGSYAEAIARAAAQFPTLIVWTEADGKVVSGSRPRQPAAELVVAEAPYGEFVMHTAVPVRDALGVLHGIQMRRWVTVSAVSLVILLLTHLLARSLRQHAKAEQEVRAALNELRLRDQALESIKLGITIVNNDAPGTPIVYANPAFAALMALPKERIIGRPAIVPHMRDAADEALSQGSSTVFRIEIPVTRSDGSEFIDNITRSTIVDGDGNCTHSVAVHEDVTNQRRRDQMLLDAQKMEDIGQLTGGVAHDFNNLLTAMKASAEDLRDELANDAYCKEMASIIIEAADKGSGLVSRLMAFARKQELRPATLSVNDLLEAFVDKLRETAPPSVDIRLRPCPELCFVHVDPERLDEALLNVVTNAFDAMPDGGKLVIECSRKRFQDDGAGAARGLKAGDYVLLSISDTGEGMPAHVLARAFNPFFTTKEVGRGTGLGLSMVYGFIQQSGGNTGIYSEVGQGTVVKIYLPEEDPAPAVEAAFSSRKFEAAAILVVEDDMLIRQVLANKLTAFGAQVVAAQSGEQALGILAANPHFDLVISDVIMPGGVNGGDMAREIRARWPETGVLLCSGYTEAGMPDGVKVPPGVNLLSKPYSNHELIHAVGKALGGALSPAR